MELGLQGKIVLITASGGGIGSYIAEAFLREGAVVIVNGRKEASLLQTRTRLGAVYGADRVNAFAGDMTRKQSVEELVELIKAEYGRLDILVANLGSGKPTCSNKLSGAEWEYMFRTNLFSAAMLVDCMLPLLEQGKKQNIVLISSITAYERQAAPYAYAAAKAGILSLANNLSGEYGPKGIRVNTVVPGNIYFSGGRWEEIRSADPAKTDRMIKETVPLGRFGEAGEVADAVVFLASERSAFTTGSALVVDGGQRKGS